jgi:hypothetical protein
MGGMQSLMADQMQLGGMSKLVRTPQIQKSEFHEISRSATHMNDSYGHLHEISRF